MRLSICKLVPSKATICLCFLLLCIGFIQPAKAGTQNGLIFCSEAGITTLNPQRSPVSNMTSTLSYAIYDRLLTMNPDTKAIVPAAGALAYTENNGLTRVYRLRHGIRFQSNAIFSPTREMTAEDVAFSFNRMLDESSPFYRKRQFFPYLTAHESGEFIDKVETRGHDLVVFKLHKPLPNFDNFLAHDNSVILSKEYADTILEKKLPPETIDYRPIGSGPFMAQEFLRDSYVRLVPFNGYKGHKPHLDTLVLRHSTHINKRFSQLFTGECQVMSNPSPSQISLILRHHKEINLEKRSSLFGTFLIFNTKREAINTPERRRAIASLINLSDLNKSVYFGYGEFQAPHSEAHSLPSRTRSPATLKSSPNNSSNSSELTQLEALAENAATSGETQANDQQTNIDTDTKFTTSGVAPIILTKNEDEVSDAHTTKAPGKLQAAIRNTRLPSGIAGLTSKNIPNPQNGEDAAEGDIINPYYNYSPVFLRPGTPDMPELQNALEALKGQELKIIILERDTLGDASLAKTAQFIKSALEVRGIHAIIKSMGYQSGVTYLNRGRYDMAIINLFSDNGNIIVPLAGCTNGRITNNRKGVRQNFTGWCSSDFDRLAQENASTRNTELLATNTIKLRDILSAEMPLLPLIYSFNTFISINRVSHLKQTPFGGLIFNEAKLAEDE